MLSQLTLALSSSLSLIDIGIALVFALALVLIRVPFLAPVLFFILVSYSFLLSSHGFRRRVSLSLRPLNIPLLFSFTS